MFTRIDLTNFRAIGPRPLNLPLRPLTLPVGENGSGKSSVLQAIALTAQSAKRTIVVTKDPHLLERAADLAALTGVETVDPTTALARWAGESEETP